MLRPNKSSDDIIVSSFQAPYTLHTTRYTPHANIKPATTSKHGQTDLNLNEASSLPE